MANEFAKMRRLRTWPVAAALAAAVPGLAVATTVTGPGDAARSWEPLLAGASFAVPLVAPVLLAVLASRQVDIEHQGGGWLLGRVCGAAPGALCRAKLAAVGAVATAATVLGSVLLVGGGLLLGVAAPVPAGLLAGHTIGVVVVNLAVLAVHILLAARVDNQLVGLGAGIIGSMAAVFASGMPPWLAHATPWGYYALSAAAGYRDGVLVAFTPSYPSVAALGATGAALFLLATARFDREEG